MRFFGESAMKTLILVVTASLVIASVTANAASANDCSQIVKNLYSDASIISQNAKSYWQHRANFVGLAYGQRRTVPNALTVAEQEKSQGNAVKAEMPSSLARFKGLVTAVQSKKCLSPAQLSAVVEPTIKLAKRVNFDQFPEELPIESSVNVGSPRMPTN